MTGDFGILVCKLAQFKQSDYHQKKVALGTFLSFLLGNIANILSICLSVCLSNLAVRKGGGNSFLTRMHVTSLRTGLIKCQRLLQLQLE